MSQNLSCETSNKITTRIRRQQDDKFWQTIATIAGVYYVIPGDATAKFLVTVTLLLGFVNLTYITCIRALIFQRRSAQSIWGLLSGDYCSEHDRDLTILLMIVDAIWVIGVLWYLFGGQKKDERQHQAGYRRF